MNGWTVGLGGGWVGGRMDELVIEWVGGEKFLQLEGC